MRPNPHWSRPENYDGKAEGIAANEPGRNFVYIKKLRPYLEDSSQPVPVDFDSLMMLAAPRPLLIAGREREFVAHDITRKAARAAAVYRDLAARQEATLLGSNQDIGAAINATGGEEERRRVLKLLVAGDSLTTFSYPGTHGYPPAAKRFSFAWLDRWLDHTPAVPTIWPGLAE
jgi:hypothetical protein